MKMSDEKITLVRNSVLSENEDLTLSQAECFDIIENTTNEMVGVISYRYNNSNVIDYFGNINYRIKEEKRGNGYAKSALSLMLNILKYNTKFDEPLYVSSTSYNVDYLNVAASCGGELIFNGQVPDNIIASHYDKEMKNVIVYKFEIEKVNNKSK